MVKKLFTLFLLVGAASMIVMSFHYFQSDVSGILKRKDIANQQWYRLLLKTHIAFGIVAITIGPFQLIRRLRNRYLIWHKRLGYTYVVSIIISGSTGLVVAQFAMGGWISSLGFSMLALLWLTITIAATQAIIKGKKRSHKNLMFLSYALTFTAIPQRTLLLVALFTDIPFLDIYRLSAWLPWILNLTIAYIIITKKSNIKTIKS